MTTALEEFDFAFAENGLTAYKLGQALPTQSFIKFLGEDKYKPFVNFILHYLADIDIPIKRCAIGSCIVEMESVASDTLEHCSGTFVEFRNGMINVSPIGRNAS